MSYCTHPTTTTTAGAYRQEVTVVIVSGPEGMGKRALAQRLIKEDQLERCVRCHDVYTLTCLECD